MVSAQLQEDREKAAEAIRQYVKTHGYVEKANKEINGILDDYNATPKSVMYQNSDLFYNWTNMGSLDDFRDDIHLFERLGRNHYRLLGPDYKYTGTVCRKDSNDGKTYIVGEWLNGELINWNPAERIEPDVLDTVLRDECAKIEEETFDAIGEDREALVKIRINQGEFRKRLLRRYTHCCLCNVGNPKLLIASHIKPWSESSPEEKIDVNNGFLFCPNHDRAFDRGFISFDSDGNIIISDELSSKDRMFLNINEDMKIPVSDENRGYLAYHRENIFDR